MEADDIDMLKFPPSSNSGHSSQNSFNGDSSSKSGGDGDNGDSSSKSSGDGDNGDSSSKSSGLKRARELYQQELPVIRVAYGSLTSASRRKLEEVLQKWSEWQTETGSSTEDLDQVLESGEKIFFPAVRVGVDKTPSLSFWIDRPIGDMHYKGSINLDNSSAPLYDRGYAVGLTSDNGISSTNVDNGLEIIDDASRCFNCGSYSHALRDCSKPRDHTAVNRARKKLKSKQNQNSGPPRRYYQNAVSGKYDDLKPGTLSAETRLSLGLGELEPPPWLNRMREIGYPPGYLDIGVKDQPSGIAIFADAMEINEKKEKKVGEILESSPQEPKKNKTITFPGVKAPIPQNADKRLSATPSGSNQSWSQQAHIQACHFFRTGQLRL